MIPHEDEIFKAPFPLKKYLEEKIEKFMYGHQAENFFLSGWSQLEDSFGGDFPLAVVLLLMRALCMGRTDRDYEYPIESFRGRSSHILYSCDRPLVPCPPMEWWSGASSKYH